MNYRLSELNKLPEAGALAAAGSGREKKENEFSHKQRTAPRSQGAVPLAFAAITGAGAE
jgi:hypothetical protein